MKQLFLKWVHNAGARDMTILAVVVLALTIPFINQAFHWDDRDFIDQARVTVQDPLQFNFVDYQERGVYRAIMVFRHPPLLSYYLAAFMKIGGESEVLLHGAFVLFPLIAAVSMYSLGRRFTRHPMVASLLLVFTPGFMVLSHTVMGNLPGVALWLAATALFVWGVDRDDWKLLILSGLAMAASIMIFAQALELAAILAVYAILKWRFRLRVFAAFVIPAAAYGWWRFYIGQRYGRAPAINYVVDFNTNSQIRSLFVFIGGSIFFPLSAWVLYLRRKVDLLAAFALLPPLITWVAVYYVAKGDLTLWQGIQVSALAVAGYCIFYGLFSSAVSEAWNLVKRRKGSIDAMFLCSWFAAVAAVYAGTTSLPYVAVRHLLPLFAPVILLFVRGIEDLWPMRPRLRTSFVVATLALTLAAGLATSIADYRLANSYRTVAAQMQEKYAGDSTRLWALGEFGFRYYMEKDGFEYLGVHSKASPGDIVVTSYLASNGLVAPLPAGFYTTLNRFDVEDGFPVRIMNPWAGAGFYGNSVGPLPFTFATDKLDVIEEDQLDWKAQPQEGSGG
ncbi:MAG: ArnT family glycosyltransferase [Thermoleophilia bacterium]